MIENKNISKTNLKDLGEFKLIEKLTKNRKLIAYKHNGFWQCMDTLRDKEILEKNLKQKKHLEKN